MRRMIISHYDYPVRYGETGLSLIPGENLIEDDLWSDTKRVSARLFGQVAQKKVENAGLYATAFIAKLKNEELSPDLLTAEEARWVVKKVKDKTLLRKLLVKATRGGVRAALQAAVGK